MTHPTNVREIHEQSIIAGSLFSDLYQIDPTSVATQAALDLYIELRRMIPKELRDIFGRHEAYASTQGYLRNRVLFFG